MRRQQVAGSARTAVVTSAATQVNSRSAQLQGHSEKVAAGASADDARTAEGLF
jgi:hypothetical protein